MVFLRCKVLLQSLVLCNKTWSVSRGCRLLNPLPTISKSVWLWSHYDPGEIRTPRLSGRRRRRKKNGWRSGSVNQKRLEKTSRRRNWIYLLFEFFSNSNHDLAREFFKQRICDSKFVIYCDCAKVNDDFHRELGRHSYPTIQSLPSSGFPLSVSFGCSCTLLSILSSFCFSSAAISWRDMASIHA